MLKKNPKVKIPMKIPNKRLTTGFAIVFLETTNNPMKIKISGQRSQTKSQSQARRSYFVNRIDIVRELVDKTYQTILTDSTQSEENIKLLIQNLLITSSTYIMRHLN